MKSGIPSTPFCLFVLLSFTFWQYISDEQSFQMLTLSISTFKKRVRNFDDAFFFLHRLTLFFVGGLENFFKYNTIKMENFLHCFVGKVTN